MNRNEIIFILEKAPLVLEELISEIPREMLKVRRRPGKWSMHENACHLAEVHPMMIERFTRFKNELNPAIKPYLPGTADTPDDYLKDLNLDECIIRFTDDRRKLINIVKSFSEQDWQNEGEHAEYIKFNPEIFLRHIMLHDQLHMYRIEELWLTKDSYL